MSILFIKCQAAIFLKRKLICRTVIIVVIEMRAKITQRVTLSLYFTPTDKIQRRL